MRYFRNFDGYIWQLSLYKFYFWSKDKLVTEFIEDFFWTIKSKKLYNYKIDI